MPWNLIADPNDGSVQLLRLGDGNEYVSVPINETLEIAICGDFRLKVDLRWLIKIPASGASGDLEFGETPSRQKSLSNALIKSKMVSSTHP